MSDLQPYERLVLALADGIPFLQAARDSGLTAADAMREAKAFGWPNGETVRRHAQEIRNEHSREESTTMQAPRKRRDEIPIEPDVEDAMTAGAALIREARASVALDRDETHAVDEAPPMAGHGLDAAVALDPPVTLSSGETITHGVVWRAAGVTDEDIDDDVPQASTAAIDRELMEDTGAILQLTCADCPADRCGAKWPTGAGVR